MKELKETEPPWAKRKGHLMDNCLSQEPKGRKSHSLLQEREVSSGALQGYVPALFRVFINDLEDESRLSVKTDDHSKGSKKRKPTCKAQ